MVGTGRQIAPAELHGQGTFAPVITGPNSAEGAYSIQVHFD
ncbi:MAG TPA: hypothetical protein VIV12_10455 [Streptosporangiaceae bacterium]